jgi:hypothetical protein
MAGRKILHVQQQEGQPFFSAAEQAEEGDEGADAETGAPAEGWAEMTSTGGNVTVVNGAQPDETPLVIGRARSSIADSEVRESNNSVVETTANERDGSGPVFRIDSELGRDSDTYTPVSSAINALNAGM